MSLDDEDGPPTLIRCQRCNGAFVRGAGDAADTCPHCRRRSLTPPQIRVSKLRTGGGHFGRFEARMRLLAQRLEHDNRTATLQLARRARQLEEQFRRWQRSPPDDETRNAGYRRAVDVEQCAQALLQRNR